MSKRLIAQWNLMNLPIDVIGLKFWNILSGNFNLENKFNWGKRDRLQYLEVYTYNKNFYSIQFYSFYSMYLIVYVKVTSTKMDTCVYKDDFIFKEAELLWTQESMTASKFQLANNFSLDLDINFHQVHFFSF